MLRKLIWDSVSEDGLLNDVTDEQVGKFLDTLEEYLRVASAGLVYEPVLISKQKIWLERFKEKLEHINDREIQASESDLYHAVKLEEKSFRFYKDKNLTSEPYLFQLKEFVKEVDSLEDSDHKRRIIS